MKVRIELTVDIDTVAWTLNYGVAGDAAIRRDVQTYAHNMVTEQLRDVGVLA